MFSLCKYLLTIHINIPLFIDLTTNCISIALEDILSYRLQYHHVILLSCLIDFLEQSNEKACFPFVSQILEYFHEFFHYLRQLNPAAFVRVFFLLTASTTLTILIMVMSYISIFL